MSEQRDHLEELIDERTVELSVANEQLEFEVIQRRQQADALRRSEEEARTIVEIGRIISSTLDINEVFELCAEQVRRLILFDRMIIDRVDTAAATLVNLYESGGQISGWEPGKVRNYLNTPTEFVVNTRTGLVLGAESDDEIVKRFPNQAASIEAGLRWLLAVPMFSKNEVIGSLHFRSRRQDAYSERDLIVAERVANQMALAYSRIGAQGEELSPPRVTRFSTRCWST